MGNSLAGLEMDPVKKERVSAPVSSSTKMLKKKIKPATEKK